MLAIFFSLSAMLSSSRTGGNGEEDIAAGKGNDVDAGDVVAEAGEDEAGEEETGETGSRAAEANDDADEEEGEDKGEDEDLSRCLLVTVVLLLLAAEDEAQQQFRRSFFQQAVDRIQCKSLRLRSAAKLNRIMN